ncbi:hypothetical protein [Fictibacillus barbaricus]|uniref:Uncharacterized protein n=1 Tax=Fictibacillus barbaricus TaxID=182136 RepID=A0ABU1TV57_9BACL|nr:hypothetical protein [Fictibacillus barbaricus]MDR7071088.1 hypothetical protein [Fictibacillus barbaricus]
MYIHETDLRKKTFDELFSPEVDNLEKNHLIHNYSLAILGIAAILISKLF